MRQNTGRAIIDCLKNLGINPMAVPGVIMRNHGPFSWGEDAVTAVYHAVVMDIVSEMNLKTILLNPNASMAQYVLDKHYKRKHGPNAYYGQNYL